MSYYCHIGYYYVELKLLKSAYLCIVNLGIMESILPFVIAHWLPLVAGLINFIWVYLEYKASIWLWPVGIVLPLFYIAVSWDALFLGNIVVNVYYLITSIIGWVMWLKKGAESEGEQPITHISLKEGLVLLFLIRILAVPMYWLMEGHSSMPFFDAYATAISFVGMVLLSRKKAEHWYCWVVANSLSALIFFHAQDYISAFVFYINMLVSVMGLLEWDRLTDREVV